MVCVQCGKKIIEGTLLCDECKKNETNPKVNMTIDEKGNTVLMAAATSGKLDAVRALISRKANVNAKNKAGWTALMRACYYGHRDIAAQLINAGADIDAVCNTGNTPLIYACAKGYLDIVSLLINFKVDVNYKTNNGFTALMCACQKGYLEIASILIEHGADVDAKNSAAYINDKENNNAKREKDNPTFYSVGQYYSGNTALMSAARRGYVDIVNLLINSGADRNALDHNGNTAMMLAKYHNHNEIVKLLEAAEEAANSKINKILPLVFIGLFIIFLIIDPFGFRASKNVSENINESVQEEITLDTNVNENR